MKEFIYSRNAVYETLRARRREVFRVQIAEGVQEKGRLADIVTLAKERGIRVERVPRARLDKVHANHQGVAAEAGGYPYADLLDILENARARNEPPFVLLLDSLYDPQNFGALLRTAEAVGVHGAVIPLAHTVEVTPAVVNASSGASEHLLIARSNLAQAIDALKEENVWVVGLAQDGETVGAKTKRHLTGAVAVVVGSEGEGIRPLTRAKCDIVLTLPMRGQIESLNAAAAGSVALYLAFLSRQETRRLED
ncbi:MAG: 23S rRNA (guanosine(2251)-2'-O)-methyltransferase RlmB [Anaerolineales bacterium]|nr:23S rRNA (guanosine(2251)-2'-O)-methyltransferase RlmB [Anaerolineales bacterium]NUQ83077.1 23S rRNA (guanosine(2251)-2'-O)-methyltransferase RlmB [Anaerolineales bacterium]